MGSLNARGHLLCAMAGGVDALWDLLGEMAQRAGANPPGVHGFTAAEREEHGLPRYCVHPTGERGVEFRADRLEDALLAGGMYLAQRRLDPDDLWRRE